MIWQRRRDLERRLNDEAAVRLAALSLELGLLAVDLRDPTAATRVMRLQDDVRVVLEELRDIGSELYPPVLVSAGVGPALRAYAERRGLAVAVSAPVDRYPAPVEAALYFAVVDEIDPFTTGPTDPYGRANGVLGRDDKTAPRNGRIAVEVRHCDEHLVAALSGARSGEVRVRYPSNGGC